jgi:murein DD-endopeptidase MepM/ murein hydrolase activator NlpD
VRFGRPRKLTPHQRREALARLDAGETQAEIARTYNVDATTIGRLLKRAEVVHHLPGQMQQAFHRAMRRAWGTDLAVPEGTPVAAAEDGVVSYAGNEFAGQGNLVLIRHSNGYSTVYAHAKELLVKRGDQIKRGQVIAHSGQTGNVNAPQLHFEVRRGATPLDPIRFLKS